MRTRSVRWRGPVAWAVLGPVAVAVVTGCVMTEETQGSNNPLPTTIPPVAEPTDLGADIEFAGVILTVDKIESFDRSANDVPRISVTIRSENTTDSVRRNPDVVLTCAETANVGEWFNGSTWEPNAALAVNAVRQGEVLVGAPLKGADPGYPVVTCSDAALRVTMTKPGSDQVRVLEFAVDPAVIDEAIDRPEGPVLPLPLQGA